MGFYSETAVGEWARRHLIRRHGRGSPSREATKPCRTSLIASGPTRASRRPYAWPACRPGTLREDFSTNHEERGPEISQPSRTNQPHGGSSMNRLRVFTMLMTVVVGLAGALWCFANSITLTSSGGGVYDYKLTVAPFVDSSVLTLGTVDFNMQTTAGP